MENHIIYDSVWIAFKNNRIDLFKYIKDRFPDVKFGENVNMLFFNYLSKESNTAVKESLILYIGNIRFNLFEFISQHFPGLSIDEIEVEYNITPSNGQYLKYSDIEKIYKHCSELIRREKEEIIKRENEKKTKYKCMYLKCNKWQTFIRINGKLHYIGTFETQEEAAKAYNNCAREKGMLKRLIKI